MSDDGDGIPLDPPRQTEVLARVAAVGLCRTDYHVVHGERRILKTSPGDNLNFTRHALCIAPGLAPPNHC